MINEKLKHFVSQFRGACLYNEGFYSDDEVEKRVTFGEDHEERYFKLMAFCLENRIRIISTNAGTYATVVRFKEND